MAALTAVFSRLLSMAVAALPVMALVLAVRAALGRAPARYRYGLWLAVGFRLACPVSVARLWSLFNLPGIRAVGEAAGTVGSGAVRALVDTAPTAAAVPPSAVNGTAVVAEAAEPSFWETAFPWCAVLWALGVLAVLLWGVVSAVRLRRTVREAVWQGGEVWICGAVPTPFVLGLLRPRIYLPPHLADTDRTYILAHERHHIRRRDPWWKLLGWCLLAVYWWNPAVWLCWVLFCRDMEMSCDEAVLDVLGEQAKRGYSLSLVAHAAAAPMPAALAFGEHDAARRVKNVLSWKKATPRMAFLAAACGCGWPLPSRGWRPLPERIWPPPSLLSVPLLWGMTTRQRCWRRWRRICWGPIPLPGFPRNGHWWWSLSRDPMMKMPWMRPC